ncbi:MAG: DUF5696 domain-containing protein [Candidatus Andersenbacteria bacterium]
MMFRFSNFTLAGSMFAVLGFCLMAPPAMAATNIVSNVGCEVDTAGWTGVNGTLSRSTAAAYTGTASCQMAVSSGKTSYRLDDTSPTVQNPELAEQYTATAWVRTTNSDTVGKPIRVGLTQSGGASAATTSYGTSLSLTTTWQQVSVTATIDAADRTALEVFVEQLQASRRNSFLTDEIYLALTVAPQAPANINLDQSLAPVAATATGEAAVTYQNGVYKLTNSQGGNITTRYEIDTTHANVQKGLLRVRETQANAYPIAFAGTSYRQADGSIISSVALSQSAAVTFRHKVWPNGVVSLYYTDTYEGKTLKKRYDLEIKGKSLLVHAYAQDPDPAPTSNYAGFIFVRTDQTPDPAETIIPYMESMPVVKFGTSTPWFLSRYVDYLKSGSNTALIRQPANLYSTTSLYSSLDTRYVAGQNSVYPAFDETIYITVSPAIDDTMANVHRSPSPYRGDLSNRVVWDAWNKFHVPGDTRFQRANTVLSQLNTYGLENLLITFHQWQNLGYDCGLPTHYPANSTFGGAAELITLINNAKSTGHLFGLHQNYFNFYINSPYWNNGTNVALDPSGAWRKGWYNANCTGAEQSYSIAADKMTSYANQELLLIQGDYQPNASFHDITTSTPLNSLLDHSSTNPNARTFNQVAAALSNLNTTVRSASAGPLSGEGRQAAHGNSDTWQAGLVDAVEREIVGREFAKIMPDYELKVVKPLMANQGMGYHGRWLGPGPDPVTDIRPSTFPFDKYRAMQMAFAHTGFLGDNTFNAANIPMNEFYRYWVKEYYTFRNLQSQYLSSTVQQILYRNSAGSLVSLGQAIQDNVDFTQSQLKIAYANGLTLYLNHHAADTWQVEVGGETHYLPPYGWIAVNPSLNFKMYSALVDSAGSPNPAGTRADFVSTPEYIMVDGRGQDITFGTDFNGNPLVSAKLKVVKPNGWTLTEQADGSLQVTP